MFDSNEANNGTRETTLAIQKINPRNKFKQKAEEEEDISFKKVELT